MANQLDPNVMDRDIKPLFHWFDTFTLEDAEGQEIFFYIRLVGDAELGRARSFALRKSAELRKKFRDFDSDEHYGIPAIDDYTKEEFVTQLTGLKAMEYIKEANEKIIIKQPKEPSSEASLEMQEQYQKDVDEWKEKRDMALHEYLLNKITQEEQKYTSISKEDIYNEFVKQFIEKSCNYEFVKQFKTMCTYFGTFVDKEMKIRFFETFEDFDNLPSTIKEQLMSFYSQVEVDGEHLKN